MGTKDQVQQLKTENETLKAVIEGAFKLVSQSSVYTPEINAVYELLGKACGKSAPEAVADWSALPNMLDAAETGCVRVKRLRW